MKFGRNWVTNDKVRLLGCYFGGHFGGHFVYQTNFILELGQEFD